MDSGCIAGTIAGIGVPAVIGLLMFLTYPGHSAKTKKAINKTALSIFLLGIGFGILVLAQYLSWHGPEWIFCHMDSERPDQTCISPLIVTPMVVAAIACFIATLAIWMEPHNW